MSQSRQLAAIMFTDIVGYTALMGDDEDKAFQILKMNRELQKPIIEGFGGKCVKEIGDGMLVYFFNATDAVKAAIAIQEAIGLMNEFQLRIGIHSGEVVFSENDVFGDGVNIASRIQACAPIGTILISESVYKNVSNKKGIFTKFLDEKTLKNVKEPVRIYQVFPSYHNELKQTTLQKEAVQKTSVKTIAVLPFINMSNDPEQEYFSDGMAEEILNSLSHLKDLKVAGRTSSFQFKGKNIDLREIGKKLDVSTVLEGSVRKQGNKVRITAQLISVSDGFHLWSEKYDRDMDDIFVIQDEIALAITENLKVILLETEMATVKKNPTDNTEAYEYYLKGRFYLNKRMLFQSLEQFNKAVEVDPDFAKAYAGLADAYVILGFYNYLPPKEVMPKCRNAAQIAIRLDNSLCEPYCSLGLYYSCFEWNWDEGKKNFIKSIQLNPKYVQSHVWFGHYYLCWIEGKFEEGEKHLNIAVEQEPYNAMCYINKYAVLFTLGKLEEAYLTANKGYELDPDSVIGNRIMGLAHFYNKEYTEAARYLEIASKLSNYAAFNQVDLIKLYTTIGENEKARGIMLDLKLRLNDGKFVSSCIMSFACGFLGDIDEAMEWLERAYEEQDAYLCIIKYYPWVPALLGQDPRFTTFLTKMNFPLEN